MRENKKSLGAAGEILAANFLHLKGYEIITRNYKTRLGEIDIIARCGEYIVFIEVKTRRNSCYGRPCQAVDIRKQQVIGNVANQYLAVNSLVNQSCRFDVIEVLTNENKQTIISHIIDAFCI